MPELLPDQVDGVAWIIEQHKSHKGVILADKMGLGKTAQAIEVARRYGGVIVIIVPAYLVPNWLRELSMWQINTPVITIDTGGQKLPPIKEGIFLTSYERAVSDTIHAQLLKFTPTLLICDEGHYLKAWDSRRARRILGNGRTRINNGFLAHRAEKILLLTGTPTTGKLEDIYNLVYRLDPDVLLRASRLQFMIAFSAHIEETPYGIKYHGVKDPVKLKKLLAPVILSRERIEGLIPPENQYIDIDARGPEIRKLLDQEEQLLREIGLDAEYITDIEKRSYQDSPFAEVRRKAGGYKIPTIIQAAQDMLEEGAENLWIAMYHRENARVVAEKLKAPLIDGSVPPQKRAEMVDQFQAGGVRVMVSTISSVREGLNITTGRTVIIGEYPLVPAELDQFMGRFHRRGQTGKVQYYHVTFTRGVDKHIKKLLTEKREIMEAIR